MCAVMSHVYRGSLCYVSIYGMTFKDGHHTSKLSDRYVVNSASCIASSHMSFIGCLVSL